MLPVTVAAAQFVPPSVLYAQLVTATPLVNGVLSVNGLLT
jgi:hypothetical protein